MNVRSVLIIAAHPDDEVFGCGGTIAKLAEQGAVVHIAFLADGISSRACTETPNAQELEARRSAANIACKILGAQPPSFGNFPDNQLDTIPLLKIAKEIEALIVKYGPETVFTHHAGDLNIDHQKIHQATVTACRPQTNHPVKTLLFFEVPSSTEWQPPGSAPQFEPNWFEDISGVFDRKMKAVDAYAFELRAWPHPRSRQGIETLARWRGVTVGVQAAEAFMLGRHRA